MSKYLLNKFLYTVDRDPGMVERYREDPAGTVAWWETEQANRILNCSGGESSTWLRFDEAERAALAGHDYPKLFELGALVPRERRLRETALPFAHNLNEVTQLTANVARHVGEMRRQA